MCQMVRFHVPNRARRLRSNYVLTDHGQAAYSLAEVLVAVFILGLLTVSLFAAFSSGLALVQLGRENLRATQILSQKLESLRLMTWSQRLDPTVATPTFTDWYDPTATNSGVAYYGNVAITPPPPGTPADYSNNLQRITVTVYWTNYVQGTTNVVGRSRQMQTLAARFGMQNYLAQ
jgi:type II secretory pathway pseudopilin PulG